MAVVLGIDFGTKRIGLAVGNTEAGLAKPLTTLSNDEQLLGRLESLIAKEEAKQLVVGLPRGLDGQETPQTAAARQFAKQLAQRTGISPVLQDEAASSLEGRQRHPKATPDSAAAAVILQDYLDGLVR